MPEIGGSWERMRSPPNCVSGRRSGFDRLGRQRPVDSPTPCGGYGATCSRRRAPGVGVPRSARRDLELLAEDREGALDAGLAAGREGPQDRPADEHAPRPEREGDRDVEAAPDAAVDPDLRSAIDRARRPPRARRRAPGRDRADARRGSRRRSRPPRVLRRAPASSPVITALEHERQVAPRADRRESIPGEVDREPLVEDLVAGVVAVVRVGRSGGSGPKFPSGTDVEARCGGRARDSRARAGRRSGRSPRSRPPPPARRGRGSGRHRPGRRAGTSGWRREPPRRRPRSSGSTSSRA